MRPPAPAQRVLSRPWVIAFQWCLVPVSPSSVPARSVLEKKILNVMALLTAAMASMSATVVSTARLLPSLILHYPDSPVQPTNFMGCFGPHIVQWGPGPAPCGPCPTWSTRAYNKIKLDEQGPNFPPGNVAPSSYAVNIRTHFPAHRPSGQSLC